MPLIAVESLFFTFLVVFLLNISHTQKISSKKASVFNGFKMYHFDTDIGISVSKWHILINDVKADDFHIEAIHLSGCFVMEADTERDGI